MTKLWPVMMMKTWKKVNSFASYLVEIKRGSVKLDGYESDESDSDEHDHEQKDNQDQEDMFADEFEEKPKPKSKFMAKSEIEGQEWNQTMADFNEDGVQMEPFNMDQELEEG
jgi:hypothetical protein